MVDDPFGAIEGHAEQAAPFGHQRFGQLRHAQKAVAGYVHGQGKAFRTAIRDPSVQVILWRKGDGVQQEVESAPAFANLIEQPFQIARHADVARRGPFHTIPFGDRQNPVLRLVVEIGGRQPRAALRERRRASRRDALFIGDPDDEAAFPAKVDKGGHAASPSKRFIMCRAIIRSSSVGITRTVTRLPAVLMTGWFALLALSSSSMPSHPSCRQIRLRISA